jgi:DNA-binding transcriptional ArsR family regulator
LYFYVVSTVVSGFSEKCHSLKNNFIMAKGSSKLGNETLIVSDKGKKITVDYAAIKKAALTLRAINHPMRKKLIELIESQDRANVTSLYKKLRMEQSVCSSQLGIMRRAKVLNATREGREIFYTVNAKRIAEIAELAPQLA